MNYIIHFRYLKLTQQNTYKKFYKNIPKLWTKAKLKSICSKIVDGNHNPLRGVTYQTGFYMLSSQNIINGEIIDLHKSRFLTEKQFIEENKKIKLEIGDILFTSVGLIGSSYVFNHKYYLCFLKSLSILTTLINPYYVKLFLDAPEQQRLFNKEASGTTQKGFYLYQLSNVMINIPPLNEQPRIIGIYNSITTHLFC
ncbi:MAG: restriction endonuclease subunit S [Bacilli bacterium]